MVVVVLEVVSEVIQGDMERSLAISEQKERIDFGVSACVFDVSLHQSLVL